MASWWRKYAETLGDPTTGNGSWKRRAAELLEAVTGSGPWEKHVSDANTWERRRGFRAWIRDNRSAE